MNISSTNPDSSEKKYLEDNLRRHLTNASKSEETDGYNCNISSTAYNASACSDAITINLAFLQKYAGSIGGGAAGFVVFLISVICLIRYEIWKRRKAAGFYEELELRQLEGNEKAVYCIAWSPNGELIATASADASLRIWSASSCAEIFSFPGHYAPVWAVAWGSDNILISCSGGQLALTGRTATLGGKEIVVSEPDNSVRIWDVHKCVQRVDPLRLHKDFVRAVAYAPDGQWFASGADDGTVHLHDAEAAELVHAAVVPGWVYGLAFSVDSRLLAVACSDSRVRIIDVESGVIALEHHLHIGRVRPPAPCVFRPCGGLSARRQVGRSARLPCRQMPGIVGARRGVAIVT